MKTDSIRTQQLSPDAYAWYLGYLECIDEKDLDGYARHLAEDCSMQMNNDPPVVGRDSIVAGLAAYWPAFASVTHEPLNVYGTDHGFALEALNHYRRHDGGKVTVRAVAFTDRGDDGLVTSIRLYTDVSPVFA